MRDAVIVEAVRTPVGKRNGGLAGVHAVDLSAHVLRSLADRSGIDPGLVDDVIWGCVGQVGEQTFDLARNAVLAAGWPESVPGVTIDRQCGSSQQSVHFAAAGLIAGHYDVVVAGGVESMSRVPMGASLQVAGNPFTASGWLGRYGEGTPNQGVGAEMMAGEQVSVDEGVRRGGTLAAMAGLRPAFAADGVVTAGNASQISDGSAALLMTTSERARELGLTPIARIHTAVLAADDPIIMLTAPIPATRKVLQRSGLRLDDIGAFEVNEAFATVPLAWLAEIGDGTLEKSLNPNGGAIALGHPLGASGARLMTTLVHHQRANGIRYGLQTMCEGGGQANATIVELL